MNTQHLNISYQIMEVCSEYNRFSYHVSMGKHIYRKSLFLILISFGISYSYAADSTAILNYLEYNDAEHFQKNKIDSIIARDGKMLLPEIKELKLTLANLEPGLGFKYIYTLHGFDENVDSTTTSEIRYTNLTGGDYKLEIITCKNEEVLAVYELPFSVLNPIQRQWWFGPLLTFCLLLIPITIFYFFILDRSRRILRLETVRNQIASDLHDDIGANLSAIKNFTGIIEKKTPKDDPSTTLIMKTKTYLDETIIGLQDTVWSINPNNDSIELLIEKMQDFGVLMLSAKGIDLEIKNEFDKKYPIILDMDQRHNLLLMFKETINNIVKHSGAKNVKIQISNNRESLHLLIQDNGNGFDAREEFRGNGLRNFKSRSRQNFIETAITSEVAKGTKVRITAYSL